MGESNKTGKQLFKKQVILFKHKPNNMKKINPLSILTGALLILINSCSPVSDPKHDAIYEIRNTWDAFIVSWHAGDAAACAAFYTEDGFNIPNEFKTNKGRQEIEAFYEFLFSMNQSSSYTHNMLSLTHSDELAVEYGEFQVDWVSNDGTEWTYKARTLVHWVFNKDDGWKIKMLLFNTPPKDA
jgi:uncharacterized protein (TIGR02246 family)